MPLSDKLIDLNLKRLLSFDNSENIKKPAAFLFSGATFDGLSIRSLDKDSFDFTQKS